MRKEDPGQSGLWVQLLTGPLLPYVGGGMAHTRSLSKEPLCFTSMWLKICTSDQRRLVIRADVSLPHTPRVPISSVCISRKVYLFI